MGQIVVLDRNMINMIAAGEVIERPASVVKELIENSIDAGASSITVSIEDGGKKLISITDNGSGMDSENLERAFESHATSKIKTAIDLNKISTLGFRGEALASIASIAQVKAVSRVKNSTGASSIEIDCGNKTKAGPASGDYGTTIEVRNIFYKLPARRKFLRTTGTEMGHITEQFVRVALANCNIGMTLTHNGREIHRLSGNQSTLERIAELFPGAISENLFETGLDEKRIGIFALLGKPGISRTNNKLQYVFLNGRFIRDKFISHAVREAYRGCLEVNRFGVVFLFIKMSCEDYDVNVHPSKIEVRFYNANLLHSQILSCLREKLLSTNLDISAKLPTQTNSIGKSEPSAFSGQHSQQIADAMSDFFKSHRPAYPQKQFNYTSAQTSRSQTTEENYNNEPYSKGVSLQAAPGTLSNGRYLQIHNSYIVAQSDDGFIIIDQHALHERILYENLRSRLSQGHLESQKMLIPETFEVTEAENHILESGADLIASLGIELASFGPGCVAIQAFPTLLSKADAIEFVRDLIDLLDSRKNTNLSKDELINKVLCMAACKAAIKAGQKLTENEIKQLLGDKEIVASASRCPHGRPTTIRFTVAELEKQFKRT